MSNGKFTVGFVRRGYSVSGGAESYLKRLGRGVAELGHQAHLFTTTDWPAEDWSFGPVKYLRARSPIGFANELENLRRQIDCDVLMSLERVSSCDIYRAGDGVHRAWLDRRAQVEGPLQRLWDRLNPKHRDLLRLEKVLLNDRGAERVIANSQMVKKEIVDIYNYRPDRIDVVRNGVPLAEFQFDPGVREISRAHLGLGADDVAVLFVGSGWERKGLRFAIEAVESCLKPALRLLVAGRGNQIRYQSPRTQFLGEVAGLARIYAAADVFILPTIYDPFSNASLEALAAGLPVITTRANGCSEIMENKIHGTIVNSADDIAELRKALDVWSDATWRAAARPTIRKHAAQFDISKNVAQTVEILIQTASEAALRSGKMRNT